MNNNLEIEKVFISRDLTSASIKKRINKKLSSKHYLVKGLTIISLTVMAFFIFISTNNIEPKFSPKIVNINYDKYDIVGNIKGTHYDRLYCSLDDLYKVSDLVIIGNADSIIKMYMNQTGLELIMTEQQFKVKEVIKGSYNNKKININYRGGIVTVAEYIKNMDKNRISNYGYDKYSFEELNSKYIRDIIWDAPIEIKDEITDYLIFLTHNKDTNQYVVISDGYGFRLIDDNNMTKIPDSNSSELFNYESVKNSV